MKNGSVDMPKNVYAVQSGKIIQERPMVNITSSGVEMREPYTLEADMRSDHFNSPNFRGKRQYSHIKHQAKVDDSEHFPTTLNLGSFSKPRS